MLFLNIFSRGDKASQIQPLSIYPYLQEFEHTRQTRACLRGKGTANIVCFFLHNNVIEIYLYFSGGCHEELRIQVYVANCFDNRFERKCLGGPVRHTSTSGGKGRVEYRRGIFFVQEIS